MSVHLLAILVILLLAGACSAVQQMVAFRMLCGVFGTEPGIIAALMGALLCAGAAGAAWISRLADRSRRPLNMFALCLMIGGVLSLMPPFLLSAFDHGLLQLQSSFEPESSAQRALAFGVAFMFSLPGVGCFCASVIAAIQYLRRREGLVSATSLTLFALCLGFAAGLVVGILFLPAIKPLWAAAGAGGVAVMIAIATAALAQSEGKHATASSQPSSTDDSEERVMLNVALAIGLSALCLMLLSRVLSYVMEESLVSAAAMAASVAIGLGLGTLASPLFRGKGEAGKSPGLAMVAFAITCALAAAACSSFYHTLTFEKILRSTHATLASELVWRLGVSFPILGLPSVILGMAIPLMSGYSFEKGRPMSESTGGLLAAMGFGAGGALLLYTTVVDFTGLQSGVAIVSFAVASLGVLIQEDKKSFILALLILVGYAVFQPPLFPNKSKVAETRVADYQEGPTGTYSVLADTSGYARSLIVDGYVVGLRVLETTERRAAHVGLSLSPNPKSVLTLGIGSGGSLKAIAAYTEPSRVDVLLPFRSMQEGVKRYCGDTLKEFSTARPEVSLRFRYGDLRSFLRIELKRWSLIQSHIDWLATPTLRRDAVSVKTLQLVRQHLTDDGLFSLTVPLEVSPIALRSVIFNFAEVFPEGHVWFVQPHQVVFVGSPTIGNGSRLSLSRFYERAAQPEYMSELERVQFTTKEELPGSRVCGISALRDRFKDSERDVVRSVDRRHFMSPDDGELAARRKATLDFLALSVDTEDSTFQDIDATQMDQVKSASVALKHLLQGLGYRLVGDNSAADSEFDDGLAVHPDDSRLLWARHDGANEISMAAAEMKSAESERNEVLKEAIDRSPGAWTKHVNMGDLALTSGKQALALKQFRIAEALAPAEVVPMFNIGIVLTNLGRHDEAILKYRSLLALDPDHLEARINLAYCLERTNSIDEARSLLMAIVQEHPDSHISRYNLASLLKREGKIEEALDSYRLAIEVNPDYPEAIFDYAVLLDENEEFYPAAVHFQKFIALRPMSPQAKGATKRIESIGRSPFRR